MTRSLQLLSAVLATALATALSGTAHAREPVQQASAAVGIIEAVLDGQRRIWHVLDSGDVSGATWMQLSPGQYNAVLTGFEPDASASGAARGSQVTISFEYSVDSAGTRYRLPFGGSGREPASVRLMPAVRDLSRVHLMQHGLLSLEDVAARDPQTFSFSGTFSGELRDDDGGFAGRLEGGTFRVDRATLIDPD